MDRKNWKKIEWLLFIISIILVLLLSLLFIYFDNMIKNGKDLPLIGLLNQVIPDLIAVLVVVICIYIFLKSKGIDTNEQFSDELTTTFLDKIKDNIAPNKIDSLVEKIASYKCSKFLRLENSKEKFLLSEKLKVAKSVWINGYSCAQLFKEFKSKIEEAIKNGTNFKIILTQPNSAATKMMEERDVNAEKVLTDIKYVESEINAINNEIAKNKNKKVGSIVVKYINWLPSCSMIFFNPDEENGEVKIKVYPPFYSTNHFNPIEMIIDRKNYQEQYEYFHEQYNRLWNREVIK